MMTVVEYEDDEVNELVEIRISSMLEFLMSQIGL
jgi:hypothetical protein